VIEETQKIYEQFRSSSVDEETETSRTSQFIAFITSKASSRNKKSSKELIKMSFKLSKNNSKKTKKSFLKNKEKQISIQFKKFTESYIDSSKNIASFAHFFRKLTEDLRNIADSFTVVCAKLSESNENFSIQSLSEKTRNEVSKIILQKLRTRNSKIFQKHRESCHSIISFSSSEVEMTSQHSERSNQNMQEMIQTVIREMMSEIIQQSVAAAVNVTAATATIRSNSFSASDHSQMISKATSKSRIDR
jgi:hypothetical protein